MPQKVLMGDNGDACSPILHCTAMEPLQTENTESHGDQLLSFPSFDVLHFVFISYPNRRETTVSRFFMCSLRYQDLCLLYLEISFEEIHVTDCTRSSTI
jgi:hypothetical protein